MNTTTTLANVARLWPLEIWCPFRLQMDNWVALSRILLAQWFLIRRLQSQTLKLDFQPALSQTKRGDGSFPAFLPERSKSGRMRMVSSQRNVTRCIARITRAITVFHCQIGR